MSAHGTSAPPAAVRPARISLSPSRRAWLRFRANRRGLLSLWIFLALFVASLGAELLSNDRPIVVS